MDVEENFLKKIEENFLKDEYSTHKIKRYTANIHWEH